ncbi:flavodoxin family protein [uncultured Methanobrevibacter sp.]|uniref:flavodoxin family protein n=1 Tax=uncultured Methanobrevibacter sp. TaxID=253161 RepID=UPI0025DCB345|nr:NAD(P)H-dependent oxidoreductase [uncultured Methanobrevibacter sp.]
MRYVIINGSPRKKNTWAVVEQVKTNLNGEFDEIHLAKENIPMCVGCYNCILKGEKYCPHFDKVSPIVERIKKADAIIMTSPVYAMNVTALLKNFLDHTAYLFHRPVCFTKKAMVIVTTAGAGHKKCAKYIDETLRHWGVNKVYKYAVACGGKDFLDKKAIDKIAVKFSKDVESKKMHSPKLNDVIFFDVWKAMAFKDNPIEADKEFWFETGLVNYDFSPDVKLGIFKVLFSKIMFRIMKKVL